MYDYNYIRSTLRRDELLCGLAEEAAELAQAALKLRRAIDCSNPTPVREAEAYEKLLEEVADVRLYEDMLRLHNDNAKMSKIRKEKVTRWADRLREREG
jgi:NTP pyrophosphatase (non-canonical NTP hydrolase)